MSMHRPLAAPDPGSMSEPSSTSAIGFAVALTATLVLAAAVFALTPAGARWSGVVGLFHDAASGVLSGHPAQSLYLSLYPPLSLGVLIPPRLLAADLPGFAFFLALEMSIVASAGLLMVSKMNGGGRFATLAGAGPTYATFVLLGAFVLPSTFDILPGVLTLAALAATTQQRGFVAGGLLGLATALKLYAVVLLPALLLWYAFAGVRRQAAMCFAGFAIAIGLGIALYGPMSPASLADLARSLAGRGLQIESVGGSFLGLAAILGFVARPGVIYAGSFDLTGGGAAGALNILAVMAPVVLLVSIAAVAVGLRRRSGQEEASLVGLVVAVTGLLLGLLIVSKVFSPQYMLWLVPVVPFLAGPKRAMLVAAMALTAAIFPLLYDGVLQLQLVPICLLVLRNLLLIVLWFWVVTDLLGRRAARGTAGVQHTGTVGTSLAA